MFFVSPFVEYFWVRKLLLLLRVHPPFAGGVIVTKLSVSGILLGLGPPKLPSS